MASILTSGDLQAWIERNDGWRHTGEIIEKTFEFSTFLSAIEFVKRVAELAEEAEHHPDIDIRYNEVRIGLVTHDAGGITGNDTELAEKIDATA